MLVSLIVPTLREEKNLRILIPEASEILKKYTNNSFEIVIVDDNSQDGTETLITKFQHRYPVRLIVRKKEKGLSGAVIRGFQEAKGEYFIVMDADLSHPPSLLKTIVEKIQLDFDFILPSRYMKGGGVEKWPLPRKVISLVATSFAHFLTKVKDPMSGYFAFKRKVIEGIQLNPIGYKILLEILVKGKYEADKLIEIPYMFQNRHIGQSKLNGKIYYEYIKQLVQLYSFKIKKKK